MILTRDEILKEIDSNNITITPFDETALGPASYDLTLGYEFRIFKKVHRILEVDENTDYKKITKLIKTDQPFVLMPGEAVHAITEEVIKLAPNICGWLQGRSRFARLGLMVHITASFMNPGIENRQVLEMFNASPIPLAVKPGSRICQFIFQRCEGDAVYKGIYKTQDL